jgi:AcrR family transcriptional regulator
MTGNFKKEDLRIIKTRNALMKAIFKLLETKSFNKITIYDICDQAMVSRATFYMHFSDKYDLLSCCLSMLRKEIEESLAERNDEGMENVINDFINDHKNLLINLSKDSDREVTRVLSDFIMPGAYAYVIKSKFTWRELHKTAFARFCVGGLMNLLFWEAERKFPQSDRILTSYVCDIMKRMFEFDNERSKVK